MESIKSRFESNLDIVREFNEEQASALLTLDEIMKRTHDKEGIHEGVLAPLKLAGYEAELIEDDGMRFGFELQVDGQSDGKNLGLLIPVYPRSYELTNREIDFYRVYAGRAGLAIHHAQLHHDLEEKVAQHERIKGFLAHELKAPIQTIYALTSMAVLNLKQGDTEEAKKHLENAKYGLQTLTDLTGLLYLSGISKRDLEERFELVDIKEMFLKNAQFYAEYLKGQKIGHKVMYTNTKENPLNILFNKSVLNAVMSTLFGNAVSYSPEGSVIYQGVKNTGKDLEMITENLDANNRERQHFGMGSGLGFPFVQSIVTHLNGEFETYNEPLKEKDYSVVKSFGHEQASHLDGYKTFGVKVSIPIDAMH